MDIAFTDRLGQVKGSSRSWLLEAAALALLLAYFVLFVQSVQPRWFNPGFATEDAFQQWFPFQEVLTPGRHAADLPYQAMRSYLMPLHWQLGALVTRITGDPVMGAHWIMLVQVLLTGCFIWLCVRRLSSRWAAHLALLWFLHSRPVLERMAGGLPRGWMAPLCAALLWCLITNRRSAAFVVLACAAFLNPPAAAVCALTWVLWIVWGRLRGCGNVTDRGILTAVVLIALVAAPAWWCSKPPPSVGSMISLSQARDMPEFQRGSGRFKFLPFRPVHEEFSFAVSRVFAAPAHAPSVFAARNSVWLVLGLMVVLSILAARRREVLWGSPLVCLAASSLALYFLARVLAFHLYVPNRYLMLPWAVFFLVALPAGVWRYCRGRDFSAFLAMALLGALVWAGSGSGLKGPAGLTARRPSPDLYRVLAGRIAPDALVAGNPEAFAGVALFSNRRLFVSSEVAHPFYQDYYREMKRRLLVVWSAVYSRDLDKFMQTLQTEGVTHFIFRRGDYKPAALTRPQTFQPVGNTVRELAGHPAGDFVYSRFIKDAQAEFVVYQDQKVVVVDVQKMTELLPTQGVVRDSHS